MSSITIPNLKLFPLYTGGPILNGKNGLNANSRFVIPATRYSSSYAVNMPPKTNAYDPNSYYVFDSKNPRYLSSQPTGSAPLYDTMLGIENGRLQQVSAPATAPEIPNAFKDRVANYAVSDANFNALMAQASFEIPGIGMGLKITTDGNGNVASESLNPSSLGTLRRTNAVGHDLGVVNRAQITTGAIYKVNDPGYSFSNINKKVDLATQNKKNLPAPSAAGVLGFPALQQNNGIFKTPSTGAAGQTGPNALGGLEAANPFLAKLNQLQPQDAGLSLSGIDAEVGVEQAQQVAVGQADFGVNLSDNFYQNMASVVSAANSQQQNSYAANFLPRLVHAMDGRVNVNPWHMPTQSNQGPLASSNVVSFNMGASVADATAGNAKNGYIPFNMQNGGSSGGGFTDANPFMGGGSTGGFSAGGNASRNDSQGGMPSGNGRQSGQQQSYYRKPLAYSA